MTGSDDQTVMIWEVPSSHALQTLRAHSHTVSAGCLLHNNKLFTAGFDEHVLLWTQDTGLLGYLKVFVVEAFDLKRGDLFTGTSASSVCVIFPLSPFLESCHTTSARMRVFVSGQRFNFATR